MPDVWTLSWRRGRLALHSAGGMLDGLRFLLEDGREVEPLYRAPWLDEDDGPADGVLANLRGEFVCLPYGKPALSPDHSRQPEDLQPEDFQLHGHPSAANWHLLEASDMHLSIGLDFPERNALRHLVRTVRIDPSLAAVELELSVEARRHCRRSIALHPSFALPAESGAFEIVPDGFEFGLAHPKSPESDLARAIPGATFRTLARVPIAGGGTGAFSRLPFANAGEEILMLCGVAGGVSLKDRENGVAYRLEWDADLLPSLVLWISNHGRQQAPWSGRNLCVGVEPCAAAFGGVFASLAQNPVNQRGVPTALAFDPDRPTRLSYRISAASLLNAGDRQ